MKREERRRGLAHLLRGGAVVVMSLFLVVVSTTPSQAIGVIDFPTIPNTIPASWTTATQAVPTAVANVGDDVANCFATRACAFTVVGTAVLSRFRPVGQVVSGGTVFWELMQPNVDARVVPASAFLSGPLATECGAAPNTYSCIYAHISLPPTFPSDTACVSSCGTDYERTQIRWQGFGNGQCATKAAGQWHFLYTTTTIYLNGDTPSTALYDADDTTCYSVIRAQTFHRISATSTEARTIAIGTMGSASYSPTIHGTISSSWEVDPNPQRRHRTETRCTTSAGVSTTNVVTSPTYTHTSAMIPGFQPQCTNGARPTGVTVIEEKKTTNGTDWVPSNTTHVLPPTPTPACTTTSCRPGLLFEYVYPDIVLDPTWTHSACVIGGVECTAQILDITNPNQPIDCGVTLCSSFQATADAVAAGTTTWAQTNYVCDYNGTQIPISQCTHTFPVSAGISYQADPQPSPSPSPSPTTPPNPDGDGFACGFDLGCYVAALFQPTPAASEARFRNVQAAFEGTPFRIIPMAAGDFLQPFSVNDFAPNSENCAGPTLTLPKDMGVDGINAPGDYVIRPLYACPDTPAGQFGAQISTYVRAILGPTVYVAGTFMVVNTLLSAMGLALPMFVRGSEVDFETGEVFDGPRWRMKNHTTRRVNGRWYQGKR